MPIEASLASDGTHQTPLPGYQAHSRHNMSDQQPNEAPKQANEQEEVRPDVTAAVDELLNTLSTKFTAVSSEIFAKMDDMAKRIDKLETELMESKAKEAQGSPAKP